MKKRKDGRYSAYIVVGYTPEGKPKRKYVYGTSVKECEKKLIELKAKYNRGLVESDSLTVKEWGELWYKLYKSTKEYNTRKYVNVILNKYIYPNLRTFTFEEFKNLSCARTY